MWALSCAPWHVALFIYALHLEAPEEEGTPAAGPKPKAKAKARACFTIEAEPAAVATDAAGLQKWVKAMLTNIAGARALAMTLGEVPFCSESGPRSFICVRVCWMDSAPRMLGSAQIGLQGSSAS